MDSIQLNLLEKRNTENIVFTRSKAPTGSDIGSSGYIDPSKCFQKFKIVAIRFKELASCVCVIALRRAFK